jgi:RHS repeat-associated protein
MADHLGTSRIVTDTLGNILDQSDFYPFGGERIITTSSGNSYKLTGKERDAESGLDNFGARYNASTMGRFMSPDAFFKHSHVGDPGELEQVRLCSQQPATLCGPEWRNRNGFHELHDDE